MNWFSTAKDAKEFFVGRLLAQAVMESVPLREDEESMLWFSAEDEATDAELVERFHRSQASSDFEARMTSLLRNARERDLASEPDAEEMWKDGYEVLRRGDHYLVVLLKPMLQASLGDRILAAFRR